MKIMNWFVKKLFANKLFTELLSQYIWLNFEQSNAKKLREFYGLEEVHFEKGGSYYWKREKLEEFDDVQTVYTNMKPEIPADAE